MISRFLNLLNKGAFLKKIFFITLLTFLTFAKPYTPQLHYIRHSCSIQTKSHFLHTEKSYVHLFYSVSFNCESQPHSGKIPFILNHSFFINLCNNACLPKQGISTKGF